MAAAQQQPINLLIPGERLVWGSITERATHDYDNKPYEEGKGPFNFGLAVRKDAPNINETLGALYQQAVAGYPNMAGIHQRIHSEYTTGFTRGDFAFKISDGDKVSPEGGTNPNTVGCWVFKFSTMMPIKATHYGIVPGVPNNAEINPNEIYRGCYCDVNVSTRVNGNTDKTAGLYLNPNAVRLLGHGERIIGGMSTEQAFADAPAPVIPVGASAMPVGPQGGAPAPQSPQAAPQVPGVPVAAQAAPVAVPGVPVAAQAAPVYVPQPAAVAPGVPIPGQPAAPAPSGQPASTTGYPSNPAAPVAAPAYPAILQPPVVPHG